MADGKGYFVKRNLRYFWAIFFLVKRGKPVFNFVKLESALFL